MAKQRIETFIGNNETLPFTSDTMEGIVLKILAAVQNPKLKFYRCDAIGMFRGSIIIKLKECGDTKTLDIVEAYIAKAE